MLATRSLATWRHSLPTVAPAVAKDLGVPGRSQACSSRRLYGVGIFRRCFRPVSLCAMAPCGQPVRASRHACHAAVRRREQRGLDRGGRSAPWPRLRHHRAGERAPAGAARTAGRHEPRAVAAQIGAARRVLAGLAMVPLTLALGARHLWQAAPVAALVLLIQIPRGHWDRQRDPTRVILHPRRPRRSCSSAAAPFAGSRSRASFGAAVVLIRS